ncbi:unnamed protein product [Adineta ricciae]|uniref:G-protein coupled receptors family 2 profile 2 domain-containing protein n=1 Tax=Adineta ricciae TaxID=249248 RepID=A0A814LQK3_ADIRI|nr:unnamed protein product [Adineta ricciae]CAF1637029.1 unnamed protein product [Adineta ricciae]
MLIVLIYLFLLSIELALSNQNFPLAVRDDQTVSKVKQTRNRPSVPQSLTLLMNFKDDGTTSFQIMQGTQIVYLDNGFCQYGQLFDPSTGYCRDIYCQELNYKFNGTTCIPDEHKNSSHVPKRMSDIDLSLTLNIFPSSHYQRGNFSKRLNSQMNDICTSHWKQMFHNALRSYLDIDYERITKIKCHLQEDAMESAEKTTIKPKGKASALTTPSSNTLYETIEHVLRQNQSISADFFFSIIDRDHGSNDTLTSLHVVTLLLLASEFHAIIDLCQDYAIKVETLSIVSDKNRTRDEFCSDPDVMYPTKNGIIRRRIRPDGELDYVVEIPELETTYESGDYTYLFMVSTLTQPQTSMQETQETAGQSSSTNSTSAMKLVSVCNRQPRIVGRCPDSLVMRLALCEIVQYTNFSIRVKRTGRLYTNREYRYDEYRPDLYVVVCKHQAQNGTTTSKKLGFFDKAPGILSSVATFLSICALAITLFTFILFSSLRNLPGCNTMNLIIALMVAEALFLCQSLMIVTKPSVCLLFALGIHFFYLASFFWMNVMAYDLWKTFHKGFSLYVYEIHERLPFYALYAWGMPVIIVVIGIVLDAANAKLKPCYGRFFRGCYDVCFRTKNDTPLQGCWIESALMRLILFGCPVAIILLINFVFYTLTVRSIRRGLKKVRVQVERKFQRKKQVVPGEHDVKIYMRMAVLAGFGWTIGFILFILPDGPEDFERYLAAVFKYLFILLNATPGLFIFGVYVCNRRVFLLYGQLVRRICEFTRLRFTRFEKYLLSRSQSWYSKTKVKLQTLNASEYKEKQEEVFMSTLPTNSNGTPVKLIKKTVLTQLLSEQQKQSADKMSTIYQATNSTSLTSSQE